MEWWVVGFIASGVISLAYLAIAGIIARGLTRTGTWGSNPLAVATALIFFTCGVGHGLHFVHALEAVLGSTDAGAVGAREHFNEWHTAPWELFTAAAAVWYFTLRRRLPALLGTTALFEDVAARRREALEIHDNVVQRIVTAKLALETGASDQAITELDAGIEASRSLVAWLLGDESTLKPGDVRRKHPSARS
jgi:hypothetical protein